MVQLVVQFSTIDHPGPSGCSRGGRQDVLPTWPCPSLQSHPGPWPEKGHRSCWWPELSWPFGHLRFTRKISTSFTQFTSIYCRYCCPSKKKNLPTTKLLLSLLDCTCLTGKMTPFPTLSKEPPPNPTRCNDLGQCLNKTTHLDTKFIRNAIYLLDVSKKMFV